MKTLNYNGEGFWSVEQVLSRYAEYVKKFQIQEPRDLHPSEHSDANYRRVYPVMDPVIEGIKAGDLACAEIGVEFIEEDRGFPFGQTLKSKTARALRQVSLTDEQKERIRKRVVSMLNARYLPREYKEFARLARKIGLGRWLSEIKSQEPPENEWVTWYHEYLKEHANH